MIVENNNIIEHRRAFVSKICYGESIDWEFGPCGFKIRKNSRILYFFWNTVKFVKIRWTVGLRQLTNENGVGVVTFNSEVMAILKLALQTSLLSVVYRLL